MDKIRYGLAWFLTEVVQLTAIFLGAIYLVWIYTSWSIIIKSILTAFILVVSYDVFKNFVYVRYALWKISLINHPKNKWDEEIDKINKDANR